MYFGDQVLLGRNSHNNVKFKISPFIKTFPKLFPVIEKSHITVADEDQNIKHFFLYFKTVTLFMSK